MGILIIIVTFLISIFSFSQIFGCLIYKIFKGKQFKYLITIITWILILFGYYLIITKWFNNYFNYYLYSTIIGTIISLFNIRNE